MIDGRIDIAVVGKGIAPRIYKLRRHFEIAITLPSAFAGHCSILLRRDCAFGKPLLPQAKVLLVG
jgi:hypothetical protein